MKIEALTNKLLQERTGETLDQFIKRLTNDGADLYSIQANLALATGEVYDRRMVVKWMDTYQ
jgi:hypothetical protein